MNKRCSKCKTFFPLSEFGSNKSNSDGKNVYCKPCVRQLSRDRYGYHVAWRTKNREHWNAKSREWVAKNKEKRREVRKRSEKKNPWVRQNIRLRYVARKVNAEQVSYDRKKIFERDNFICRYCGDAASQIDHVIPLSRGGADKKENVVAACALCNQRKGTKTAMEFVSL